MAEPDYLREFEFLPNLPKSHLDDRTFEDLVQECILRIPRYCPEWTNHNPGDPGITLIELFSWLVKQMLFRFNQVPRRHYVAFLELLGIRLQPPTPAEADITFHLVKAQPAPLRIAAYTEVATIRTETEPAVVFTTKEPLVIGQPKLQNLFTARTTNENPKARPTPQELQPLPNVRQVDWQNLNPIMLFETCSVGNCFYLLLSPQNLTDEEDSIRGNVIAITFRGEVAAATGVNPDDPPLSWEAWDGQQWKSEGILRQGQDDRTKGFSFQELRRQGVNVGQSGADVILHLPQTWKEDDFGYGDNYRGYWIRCVYKQPEENQGRYTYSPIITSLEVRSIGGTIRASECVRVAVTENEAETRRNNLDVSERSSSGRGISLGVSDGRPGQVLQLQGAPILKRQPDEHIFLKLPDGTIQDWIEVPDFGNSTGNDPHYIIDSLTGTVQFGPLIREPSQLRQKTLERSALQPWGKQMKRLSSTVDPLHTPLIASDIESSTYDEWQYGKVPPKGAEIYITAYRIGGGSRGNVKAGKLNVLRTAIPYVKEVINYSDAEGGREGESLDEAVMRVPYILRSSQVAVTAEDFETIARRSRSVYRAHCPPEPDTPGVVRLLVVPTPGSKFHPQEIFSPSDFRRDFPTGMNPDKFFSLESLGQEQEQLEAEINRRKPLGIQLKLDTPSYTGVKVIVEVLLEEKYNSSYAQSEMRSRLLSMLYRFLNPITGGFEFKGWPLGRAVSQSDIAALFQNVSEVRYVGAVKLFSIRKHPYQGWLMGEIPELTVHPGEWGLICSWNNEEEGNDTLPQFAHEIEFMN